MRPRVGSNEHNDSTKTDVGLDLSARGHADETTSGNSDAVGRWRADPTGMRLV